MTRILMWLTVPLADAAGADKDRFICPTHSYAGEWLLRAATWTPDTAVASDGTDYRTISLKRGSTTLATITTNGTAWVAGTPVAFDIDETKGTDLEFTANTDAIEIDSTKTGATGKVANGLLVLCFERHI